MIKSIEPREKKVFIDFICDYHHHLQKYPMSLLMKFIGFYSYKSVSVKSFIMFNNFLHVNVSIDEKFDLKGSTKDREANSREKAKKVPVLLDLDFLSMKRKISMGDELKKKFMLMLREDSSLLSRYNAMDYSLLIGIHKITEDDDIDDIKAIFKSTDSNNNDNNNNDDSGSNNMVFDSKLGKRVCTILSTNEDEIYFIGIIDCLTLYDTEKKIAHGAKSIKYTAQELSTVNAQFYSERFCEFINSIIE
eukprot:TRINITY_DN2308_c0_g1_i1.p1 TRINITY_DN2308_c0_g1~~TRINITY_DN2308_c0_g1_i1.p1  ORF type:complete len:248 (-),score=66.33 TRINITY_DN2308_c0_g1_i1:206-949(-)